MLSSSHTFKHSAYNTYDPLRCVCKTYYVLHMVLKTEIIYINSINWQAL